MQLKKVGTCTFLLSCCPGMRFKEASKKNSSCRGSVLGSSWKNFWKREEEKRNDN